MWMEPLPWFRAKNPKRGWHDLQRKTLCLLCGFDCFVYRERKQCSHRVHWTWNSISSCSHALPFYFCRLRSDCVIVWLYWLGSGRPRSMSMSPSQSLRSAAASFRWQPVSAVSASSSTLRCRSPATSRSLPVPVTINCVSYDRSGNLSPWTHAIPWCVHWSSRDSTIVTAYSAAFRSIFLISWTAFWERPLAWSCNDHVPTTSRTPCADSSTGWMRRPEFNSNSAFSHSNASTTWLLLICRHTALRLHPSPVVPCCVRQPQVSWLFQPTVLPRSVDGHSRLLAPPLGTRFRQNCTDPESVYAFSRNSSKLLYLRVWQQSEFLLAMFQFTLFESNFVHYVFMPLPCSGTFVESK